MTLSVQQRLQLEVRKRRLVELHNRSLKNALDQSRLLTRDMQRQRDEVQAQLNRFEERYNRLQGQLANREYLLDRANDRIDFLSGRR